MSWGNPVPSYTSCFIPSTISKASSPSISKPLQAMGEATKIIRSSINVFLQGYHSFASIAALLVFPVSVSILLSQALITTSPSSLQPVSSRLRTLFQAAGFPPASQLFHLLNLMLSQTILSAVFTLPFTVTFLNLAKVSVIRLILEFPRSHGRSPPRLSSFFHMYCNLLLTHLFNSFVILSANAAVFSFLFLAFNAAEILGLSSSNSLIALSFAGAILYSIVIANTVVTCNLAMVVSAMENCSGYLPVLKACVLIRGRVSTALSISLPANLGMAAIEALFQYKVMRQYHMSSSLNPSVIWEGFTIAYIYSILIVLDIIVSCLFFKSCKLSCRASWQDECGHQRELEPEDKAALKV